MRNLLTGGICLLWLCSASSVALAGDGPVRLQTGDASCPSTTGRFVNCRNGTVTDNLSGLIWTQNGNCWGGELTWYNASIEVLNLADGFCGLTDGSSPGEWRLPTIEEWENMMAPGDAFSCSTRITNDAGDNCWGTGTSSFTNVQTGELSNFWSATTEAGNLGRALTVNSFIGGPSGTWGITKSQTAFAWAVRGGQ